MIKFTLSAAAVLGLAGLAQAQIGFTGLYTQDFNGLAQSGTEALEGRGPHAIEGVMGHSGVEGWFGANFDGTAERTEFKAHDGSLASSGGRGIISFGFDGSSERALGALPTSNQRNSFGLVLRNDTDAAYTGLRIQFTGEQWRAGDFGIENVLSFFYGFGDNLEAATTSEPALDFFSPFIFGGETSLDGNDPANQQDFDVTIDLDWAPGTTLVLRWNMSEGSGQDNGMGIDDLRLEGIGGGGTACRADIDGDGSLTIFDFLAFQNLFAAGDLRADFDGDGQFTIFDFLTFQNEFAAGC